MKNCKKILIITSEFPPQPGGIGNHAYNLALKLQENGYCTSIFTDYRLKNHIEEDDFDKDLPIKVIRINRSKFRVLTYLSRIITFIKIANKHSIIIASGKFSLWMVGLSPFTKKKKKTAIIHGSEVNLQGFLRKVTNKSLKRFQKIIAVSNFTKSLIDNLNLNNVSVIHNGFTISKYQQQKPVSKSKAPILITVGSVTERKGQINIIKALPTLLKTYPMLRYKIVGIPSERVKLEKLAKELDVMHAITFFGKVSEKKKYKLIEDSSIFVMLSNSTESGDVEGFGIAILEANASGLPAIGAKNTGIEDAIYNEKSGLLVNAHDADAITKAVSIIWNNYYRYQKNSLEWSSKFGWDIIIEQYINTLKK